MNKKIFSIFLILMFLLAAASCKSSGIKAEEERIPFIESVAETTSETAVVDTTDPLEEKLNRLEIQYSSHLREKIESVSDEEYRKAILDDDKAIEAINFFDYQGYSDLLLDKRIALQKFGLVKLYEILKNYDKEIIEDYIKNVTDPVNDNAIAFIVTNNIEDTATGFSAFIAHSFNLPYFIISYKDGQAFDPATNLTLDEVDEGWKTKGIYPCLCPFIEELNNARTYGETENIKIDKTKEEILGYLKELIRQYSCIYFFSNGHESGSFLVLHSSEGIEKLSSFELYETINNVQEDIVFKRIGNNCGDGFDIELNSYLAKEDNISFSLLSSSKGGKLNMSPNILDAIAFSMQYLEADPVTIEELKRLGSGKEKVETYVYNNRSIDSFETGIPDYKMELDSGGPADFEPELRTNMEDKSIFYIKLNYFKTGS